MLAARATMEESPEFERQRQRKSIPDNPLSYALRHHRQGIIRGFAISALGSITYYVGITYVPLYLTSTGAFREADALWLATLAAAVVIIVTPITGALSDWVGRKPVLIGLALASAALPMGMFTLLVGSSLSAAISSVVVLAALAGAVSAVGAVATAEQFAGEARLSGLAFGATTATVVFGGLAPYVAQLVIERTAWTPFPGAMIALVALSVLPLLIRMRETRPISGEPRPQRPK